MQVTLRAVTAPLGDTAPHSPAQPRLLMTTESGQGWLAGWLAGWLLRLTARR